MITIEQSYYLDYIGISFSIRLIFYFLLFWYYSYEFFFGVLSVIIVCNNTNYIQILGTVMGTKMAPTYATLTQAYLEENRYKIIGKKNST